MAAEVQAARVRGKAELAAQLIGVIDNLERALAGGRGRARRREAPTEPLARGLLPHLPRAAAPRSSAPGSSHSTRPASASTPPVTRRCRKSPVEGTEPGTVVETMQKGYRLGEQLIRPARVVVSE